MYYMMSCFPICLSIYLMLRCRLDGFLGYPSVPEWFCVCCLFVPPFYACFNCGKRRNPRLHAHMLRARIRANYEERRGRQSGRDGRGRPGLQLASWLVQCSLSHVSLILLLYCKVLKLLILVSLFSLQHLRSVWPIRAWLMGECGD